MYIYVGFIINASLMILIYFMITYGTGEQGFYIQFISEVCNFYFYLANIQTTAYTKPANQL